MKETIQQSSAEDILKTIEQKKLKLPEQPYAAEVANLQSLPVELASVLGPFNLATETEVILPDSVQNAIGNLLLEYLQACQPFISRNTEKDSQAYHHAQMPGGLTSEPFFQIDSVALGQQLLNQLDRMSLEEAKNELRGTIFEFEPSIAMYELIQTFAGGGQLKGSFRQDLDTLRLRHNKPVVILAPTQAKHEAVLATEFGLPINHNLSLAELSAHVNNISGFDGLLGPEDLITWIHNNGVEGLPLFYVRPSDPIEKLRNPKATVEEPLLGNQDLRQLIRRNAVTLNIDNPNWTPTDPRRLKDSKATLPLIGMAHRIRSVDDIDQLPSDQRSWRAKPRSGVFGAYGQIILDRNSQKHRRQLADELNLRGTYLVQPEMAPLMVVDRETESQYLAMDRNFYSMVSGSPKFLGGIRILIPANSIEAKKGRLHGNSEMISMPIVS